MSLRSILFMLFILTAYVSASDESLCDPSTSSCENPPFKPYENVYVINLKSRPDRLAFMRDILNEINQPFIRFEAYNGKELYALCNKYPSSFLHPKIAYSCEDFIRDHAEKKCKDAEIGCWLSHLKVFIDIVENYEKTGNDNPSIILEDDIDMDVNFKELVNQSLMDLPSDWEVFHPGWFYPHNIQRIKPNIAFAPHFTGAFAYVVRNAQAAKKLISYANMTTCQLADYYNLKHVESGELKSYIAFPQQYVSFFSQLGTDLDNPKEGPGWIARLKDSTLYKIINKRK